MAVDLSSNFGGVKLKNPFVLSASHASKYANFGLRS